MSNKNQSKFPNYVSIEGDGNSPRLYCPVCGKQISETTQQCPHFLFLYDENDPDGFFSLQVNPKLNAAVKPFKEKYVGYLVDTDGVAPSAWDAFKKNKPAQPSAHDLVSALHLDPNATMVLSVTNVDASLISSIRDTVVGIEFPPAPKYSFFQVRKKAGKSKVVEVSRSTLFAKSS